LAETPYPKVTVAVTLDELKSLGFLLLGNSLKNNTGIEDVVTPGRKREILEGYEVKADKVQSQYRKVRPITDDERRQELIEIWTTMRPTKAKRWKRTSQDQPI
jgi:DNA-directed RNA polymerase subunit beta'